MSHGGIMSLIKKLFKTNEKGPAEESGLQRFFLKQEASPDFSYRLAIDSFYKLKQCSKNQTELFFFLLEDIIFSSIYATFYEQVFIAIYNYPEKALDLIEVFSNDNKDRELLIAKETENHLNFIESKGLCEGCSSCKNHKDVAELIQYWQRGDLDFFINLYIGMHTIQFAAEHLLYDIVAEVPGVTREFTHENILKFRQFIFDYAETKNIENNILYY